MIYAVGVSSPAAAAVAAAPSSASDADIVEGRYDGPALHVDGDELLVE